MKCHWMSTSVTVTWGILSVSALNSQEVLPRKIGNCTQQGRVCSTAVYVTGEKTTPSFLFNLFPLKKKRKMQQIEGDTWVEGNSGRESKQQSSLLCVKAKKYVVQPLQQCFKYSFKNIRISFAVLRIVWHFILVQFLLTIQYWCIRQGKLV